MQQMRLLDEKSQSSFHREAYMVALNGGFVFPPAEGDIEDDRIMNEIN